MAGFIFGPGPLSAKYQNLLGSDATEADFLSLKQTKCKQRPCNVNSISLDKR